MLILDCKQGSDEWFKARTGIPTASSFKKIVTSTGKASTQAKDYAYLLAGERVLGGREESYTNHHMERGKELEKEARSLYEFITEQEVQEVGICFIDDSKAVSCSPDGLVGELGGLEIKCPSLSVHTKYLHQKKCPTDYVPQVQGSLYVTGREWWDFMSYYPGMPELIIRCYPDKELQEAIQKYVSRFIESTQKIEEELRGNP